MREPILARQAAWLALCIALSVGLATHAQSVKPPNPQRQNALALEAQGKNAEAETAWRIYLKANPTNPEAYAHLGILEARQQRYKEAIPLYRKALNLGPDVPGLRLNLGLALFKSGDLKDATIEFGALLKSQPDNQQLNTLMGMSYYGLAEYASAVPYLRLAAQHDLQNLPLRLAVAESCLWSKQTQCVLDVYHEILQLNPDSAEADMLAGEALDEMKDNEGATKMFRAAVKADSKLPNANFGLGYLLWSQKLYKEASAEFEAELSLDPKHVQASLYLADSDIQLNRMDDAKPLLEQVLQQSPTIPLVHLDLGIVYSAIGRNEDALRQLTAAEKLMPNDVNVHWRLGRLYRLMGNTEQARIEFENASKLNAAADEDLYRKIDNGRLHPPPSRSPQTQDEPANEPQPQQPPPTIPNKKD